ncbi:MAG: hypothetical protein SGJ27_29045 [Candidatus Melainabacteria bacterium]|nr:hypothetical protein [Candidatus Melainabacteria bacterium]
MKTMQTMLVCSVLLLLVIVLAVYRSDSANKSPPLAVISDNVTASSTAPAVDPDNLQAVVPDGQELTFDEFQKRAGKVAQLLSPLKPTHIKRTGNRFILTTTPTTIQKQGVTVYIAARVSCEATKSGNVITLKNIDGVEVNVGIGGKLKLKEAVITPGANDKATVDGKLEVSRWLPDMPFSITVDTRAVP